MGHSLGFNWFRTGFLLILFILATLWWTKWGLQTPYNGRDTVRLPFNPRKKVSRGGLLVYTCFLGSITTWGLFVWDVIPPEGLVYGHLVTFGLVGLLRVSLTF